MKLIHVTALNRIGYYKICPPVNKRNEVVQLEQEEILN